MGRAEHFVRFTPSPELEWKSCRVDIRLGRETNGSGKNMSTSSAETLNLKSSSPFVYPFMFRLVIIALASGSMARVKINGDNGQPCLVPQLSGKYSEEHPGSLIRVCGLWYNALKPLTNSPGNQT